MLMRGLLARKIRSTGSLSPLTLSRLSVCIGDVDAVHAHICRPPMPRLAAWLRRQDDLDRRVGFGCDLHAIPKQRLWLVEVLRAAGIR